MNKELINYILHAALQYRLSLSEVCELLRKDTSRESQMKVYHQIMDIYSNDLQRLTAYRFLFNYDTVNKSKDDKEGYRKAMIGLLKYIYALKQNKPEEIKKIEEELNEIDIQARKVKANKNRDFLTLEEAIIISKYRVKYGLSRSSTVETLEVGERALIKKEALIEDQKLKKSLEALNTYYYDVIPPKKWKNK